MTQESKWLDVQRRIDRRHNEARGVVESERPHWYGRMKVNGKWKWFRLYTDKRASQQRWQEIIRQAEQRHSGVITPQMDAAQKPLTAHVAEYLASLERTVSDAHYRIARGMLLRFINAAGWKILADITPQSASRVLTALEANGKTVAYTNQYLTRVKAFINWCIPDRLLVNPLAKVKRGNAKKALKRRARRPLAEHELAKLLDSCPESRRLKYAFPAYTGLRRKELEDVGWGDLHLDSVIPYIQLRAEQTKTGEATALPLHPYLVQSLLSLTPGMPEAKLFSFLPEGRTMLRDLTKAGVKQADANGRRADYHGLRHTFAKRLDATGCSHATRRALMRHSAGDQTDGYTLARLSEMYEAVKRLPAPAQADKGVEAQAQTGTDNVPLSPAWDMGGTQVGHGVALLDTHSMLHNDPSNIQKPLDNQSFGNGWHHEATSDLLPHENGDSVLEIGPRSSVG